MSEEKIKMLLYNFVEFLDSHCSDDIKTGSDIYIEEFANRNKIDIPTDLDIQEYSLSIFNNRIFRIGFQSGAKWLRDYLLK